MPGVSQAIFVAKCLVPSEVEGRRVIDVGSKDFNGSIKPLLLHWKPASYIGVDIEEGPSVDRVVSAVDLEATFGSQNFDIVFCAEMLEHADDWKRSISNMKQIVVPGGLILLTTRSRGYPIHGFPRDFWRFSEEDMRHIFSDFEIVAIEKDWVTPGIFILARKPTDWVEADLSDISIFNVLTDSREQDIPDDLASSKHYKNIRLKMGCKECASKTFIIAGRIVSKVLRIT